MAVRIRNVRLTALLEALVPPEVTDTENRPNDYIFLTFCEQLMCTCRN